MTQDNNHTSTLNPGFAVAVSLFALYLITWGLFMVLIPGLTLSGIPLITWSHIVLGVAGVILSVVLIFTIDKWEHS